MTGGSGQGSKVCNFLDSMHQLLRLVVGNWLTIAISPSFLVFLSLQITDRSEAASVAVQSIEIKHGEPVVVQFAAP